MDYQLAEQLRDAGFPQTGGGTHIGASTAVVAQAYCFVLHKALQMLSQPIMTRKFLEFVQSIRVSAIGIGAVAVAVAGVLIHTVNQRLASVSSDQPGTDFSRTNPSLWMHGLPKVRQH